MTPELIARINELTRISKERTLTPEEQEERALLRRRYLDEFKEGTRRTLDQTVVVYPDGRRESLREANRKKKQ